MKNNSTSFSLLRHPGTTLLALSILCVSFEKANAVTRTWDGGPSGTNLSMNTLNSWSGDVLPTAGDIAQWDGTVAGNLSLTYNGALGGGASGGGIGINVTSGQTGNLTVNAVNAGLIFRTANFTVESGAGAVTWGATAGNSYRILLQGASGPTHTFTNSSSNVVTFTSSGTLEGNTSPQSLVFDGSGSWQVDSTIIATNMNNLTKSGTGTLTLTGSNSYSGTTTVNAGTLLVNNTAGSATGTNSVSVGASATLGGTGNIGGVTSVSGTLAPGAAGAAGLLTISNDLTLSGNAANSIIQISGTSRGVAGGYDAVNLGMGEILTYDGTLTLTMTGLIANGTYDIFNFNTSAAGGFDSVAFAGGAYSGPWTEGTPGVWTVTSGGQGFTFTESSGDLLVVPEPSAVLLFGMAGGFLLFFRKRTRRMC